MKHTKQIKEYLQSEGLNFNLKDRDERLALSIILYKKGLPVVSDYGLSITQICNISRPRFYKWLELYNIPRTRCDNSRISREKVEKILDEETNQKNP